MGADAGPWLSERRRMLVALNYGSDHGDKDMMSYLSGNRLGESVEVTEEM